MLNPIKIPIALMTLLTLHSKTQNSSLTLNNALEFTSDENTIGLGTNLHNQL